MFKFQAKSLATKLIAVTGGIDRARPCSPPTYVLISQTQDRVETLVLDQARTEAKAIASDIASNIAELAGAARSTAGVIGRGHEGGYLDRKGVVDMLKANVETERLRLRQLVCRRAQCL